MTVVTKNIFEEYDRWRMLRRELGIDPNISVAQWVAQDDRRLKALADTIGPKGIQSLRRTWCFFAREDQLAPEGEQPLVQVVSAGRGWGKTAYASSRMCHFADHLGPEAYFMVIGRTAEETRDISVFGPSGVIAHAQTYHPDNVPRYVSAQTKLVWPSGTIGYTFSAETPNSLRGRSASHLFFDELGQYQKDREVFDQAMLCLRKGEHPAVIITTTPKPTSVVLRQMKEIADTWRELDGLMTEKELERRRNLRSGLPLKTPEYRAIVTTGSSYTNLPNLSEAYRSIIQSFENTSMASTELFGEIVPEWDPEAVFRPEYIEHIPDSEVHTLRTTAIGVDPSGSVGTLTGIVCAGLEDYPSKRCVLLGDLSMAGQPHEWAEIVVDCYIRLQGIGCVIVLEDNYGGNMCQETIEHAAKERGVWPMIHRVPARQSKLQRAHPISMLYQKGLCVHVGLFEALEREYCTYTGRPNEKSPNRMDAAVHAIGFLMLGGSGGLKIYGRDFQMY